jgi:hypothetical protein
VYRESVLVKGVTPLTQYARTITATLIDDKTKKILGVHKTGTGQWEANSFFGEW